MPSHLNAKMVTAFQNHGCATMLMTAKTEVMKLAATGATERTSSAAGIKDVLHSRLFAMRTTTAATVAMKRFAAL